METELKQILNDLNSLKKSLSDPSHQSQIHQVIHPYMYILFFFCNWFSFLWENFFYAILVFLAIILKDQNLDEVGDSKGLRANMGCIRIN